MIFDVNFINHKVLCFSRVLHSDPTCTWTKYWNFCMCYRLLLNRDEEKQRISISITYSWWI